MSVYRLTWACINAILQGYGKQLVFFDTEARTYEYHLALVGSAHIEPCMFDNFVLGESRNGH